MFALSCTQQHRIVREKHSQEFKITKKETKTTLAGKSIRADHFDGPTFHSCQDLLLFFVNLQFK